MKIGILTFASVANFGANLQAFSTYSFLKNKGHNPIIIDWLPNDFSEADNNCNKQQIDAHCEFLKKNMNTTNRCVNDMEICQAIKDNNIESIIIGSDAVFQDFPTLARIKISKKTVIRYEKISAERLFPNAFWGSFLEYVEKKIPVAIMSASSQNTQYKYIGFKKKKQMDNYLTQYNYISVRDSWTQNMINYISNKKVLPVITPDPVFAFNQNCDEYIPSKQEIIKRYALPEKYLLFSFKNSQIVSKQWLKNFKDIANRQEYACVALPMPTGISFEHNLDIEISTPLSPVDWYALIKYSSGYIGQNMHPVIVALHNNVPVFCFDSYGIRRLANCFCVEKSSKIYHILEQYSLLDNRITTSVRFPGKKNAAEVFSLIENFDKKKCTLKSEAMLCEYNKMMDNILLAIQ